MLGASSIYCIYLMSGDITVSAKGKPAEKAKLNQFLSDNQELKLGGKAQLTLVTRESKYLVLNTPNISRGQSITKSEELPTGCHPEICIPVVERPGGITRQLFFCTQIRFRWHHMGAFIEVMIGGGPVFPTPDCILQRIISGLPGGQSQIRQLRTGYFRRSAE